VIAKRQTGDCTFEYYLNDGVYGSFNCKVFDHADPQPLTLDKEDDSGVACHRFRSILWGPTCDSLDKVHDGVHLPEIKVGEWLVFRDMGAYTMSAASTFNGFSKPTLKYIVSEFTEAILARTILGRELIDSLHETAENDPLSNVELKKLHTDTISHEIDNGLNRL